MGYINAKSYFQVATRTNYVPGYNNSVPDLQQVDVYDSIVLIAKINYHYGDTTKPFAFQVRRINDVMNVFDNRLPGLAYYNRTDTPATDTLLGTFHMNVPHPVLWDSVRCRLSDNFGLNLFDRLMASDPVMTDQLKFSLFFNGIAICPITSDSMMIGFTAPVSTSTKSGYFLIRMYTHNGPVTSVKDEHCTDFDILSTSTQFNSIVPQFGPTKNALQNLTNQRQIVSSNLTGGCTFVQAGSGYRTMLSFPYLKSALLAISQNYQIISATLYVPVKDNSNYISTNQYMKYPNKFCIWGSNDGFNSLNKYYGSNINSKIIVSTQSGIIPSYYAFNALSFVNDVLQNYYVNTPQIIVSPQADLYNNVPLPLTDQSSNSLDRIIIQNGDPSYINNVRLRLVYWIYPNNN
jgi:hypothetical protein